MTFVSSDYKLINSLHVSRRVWVVFSWDKRKQRFEQFHVLGKKVKVP